LPAGINKLVDGLVLAFDAGYDHAVDFASAQRV